jgi:SAM-dependent methyltransferase
MFKALSVGEHCMSMVDFAKQVVPKPALLKVYQTVRSTPKDLLDWLRGDVDPLVPPRRRIFIGGGEFRSVGDGFFSYFKQYGNVTPESRILDIGCGIGRMARPLVTFLDPARGSYDGFDIVRRDIVWCLEHYLEYPHFRFKWASVYNKFYNPTGHASAEEYTFPYADGSFDFAFATSVFTHMPPKAIARYLQEIHRVLGPGGRALLTAFLWTPESQTLVNQGKSSIPFREHGGLIVRDPDWPEDAIAIREVDWTAAVRSAGLEPIGDILWGGWCGRSEHVSYQDMFVVKKPG